MFEKIEIIDNLLDERSVDKEIFTQIANQFGFRWEKGGIKQCHHSLLIMQSILMGQIALEGESRKEIFITHPVFDAKARRAFLLHKRYNNNVDTICAKMHGLFEENRIRLVLSFIQNRKTTLNNSEKRLYGLS